MLIFTTTPDDHEIYLIYQSCFLLTAYRLYFQAVEFVYKQYDWQDKSCNSSTALKTIFLQNFSTLEMNDSYTQLSHKVFFLFM